MTSKWPQTWIQGVLQGKQSENMVGAGQGESCNGQGEEEVGRQQNEVGAKSARTSFFTGVMVIYAYLMTCTNEQIGLVHLDLASN